MSVEFAKPSPKAGLEPWTDASVRAFEPRDAERCAGLLAARFGFTPYSRDFRIPGVHFKGGVGVLFRLGLGSVTAAPNPN